MLAVCQIVLFATIWYKSYWFIDNTVYVYGFPFAGNIEYYSVKNTLLAKICTRHWFSLRIIHAKHTDFLFQDSIQSTLLINFQIRCKAYSVSLPVFIKTNNKTKTKTTTTTKTLLFFAGIRYKSRCFSFLKYGHCISLSVFSAKHWISSPVFGI